MQLEFFLKAIYLLSMDNDFSQKYQKRKAKLFLCYALILAAQRLSNMHY